MTLANRQIYIVDDDAAVRDSLTILLETHDYAVETYKDGEVFLGSNVAKMAGIVLLDIRMPGRNGMEVLSEIKTINPSLFIVMMSGHADIAIAVKSIKDGAFDFIEKPFHVRDLLPVLDRVHSEMAAAHETGVAKLASMKKLAKLTRRESQVLTCVVDGKPNKTIAAELGISVRTVETHRARLMSKLDAGSVSDLVKIAIDAGHPDEFGVS